MKTILNLIVEAIFLFAAILHIVDFFRNSKKRK